MASNSEATGYSNYIMQSGVALTTTTSLNLMDKAATRERIKTTHSIILGLDEKLDAVETLTSNGETDKAQILINEIISTAKNAETSNHFTDTERKKFEQDSATRFAMGTLRSKMENLSSPQAERVLRAIASGTAANLNEQQHSEELNILSDALRYFTTTSEDGTRITDYDAIRALAPIVEQQKLEIERKETEQRIANNIVDMENFNAMNYDARLLGDKVFADNSVKDKKETIIKRYDAAVAELNSREFDQDRRMGETITLAQEKELRTEISKGLLIVAYDDLEANGLSPAEIVDKIKGSFIRRGTVTGLTGEAHTAMSTLLELTKRGPMSSADIDEFINDLSDTDFRTTEAYKQKQRTLVSNTIKDYTENVSTKYDEGVKFITDTKFLSETQRQAELIMFARAKADNIIGNVITDETTSVDLQAAMNYVVNKIEDEDNLPPELKDAVDEAVKLADREIISARLRGRQTIIEGVEADNKRIQEKVELITDVLNGNFVMRNAQNEKDMEEYILQMAGMGEEFFLSEEAFNPNNRGAHALLKAMEKGLLPPSLRQMFNDLAEGRVRGNEQDLNILTLYQQFSKQPRGKSANVNLFNNLGMEDTAAKLEAISNARLSSDRSVSDIAASLKTVFDDTSIKDTMEQKFAEHFKKKTNATSIDANLFVKFAVPDAAKNPQALDMLESYAAYMGAIGTKAGSIEYNLKTYYEGMFSDTEGYVIDSASVRGDKSRYSFNHLFPDKRVKDFFINKVNNELATLMFSHQHHDSGISLRLSTDDNVENRAYLMPMGVSEGGGIGFMAVFRKDGELIPVLDYTGYPIGFSTSEQDVKEFAKSISVNSSDLIKNYTMQEINEIKGSRSTRTVGQVESGDPATDFESWYNENKDNYRSRARAMEAYKMGEGKTEGTRYGN
tara:strand:+ start:1 stop:2715 length:2715 start_codon:yes stop_codon:yes gene_type:complete